MASLPPVLDREKFEKELNESISKATLAQEVPPKEKHVRNSVISTWKERGCVSYWKSIKLLPLFRSNVVCWKTCLVIHRTFRDGYKTVVKDTAKEMKFLSDLGKHWGHAVAGYAPLITAYIRVLMNRVTFKAKHPEMPGNLNFEDTPFKTPTDIDDVFPLAVEVFDVQSSLLHLYAAILQRCENLSVNDGNPMVRCKLVALIPAIQDSSALYDIEFKLMKALHAALPAETLSGHRERFNRQYLALRKYFNMARQSAYVLSLVNIPTLDPEPPSFLLPDQLIELELAKKSKAREQPPEESSLFDTQFGNMRSESFDFPQQPPEPQPPAVDERDSLIDQLLREITELKERISLLESQHRADQELMAGIRERCAQLEAELRDYKEIAEQTCNENVLLKRQIDASQSEQGAQSEAEERARSAEDKFSKLREVYQKLRTEHITLLRNSSETQKQLSTVTESVKSKEEMAKALEDKVSSLTMEIDELKVHATDETAQVSVLREQLRKKAEVSVELERAQQSLSQELANKFDPKSLVDSALGETRLVLTGVIEGLEDGSGVSCTIEHLVEQTKLTMDSVDNAVSAFSLYHKDPQAVVGALSCLPGLTHSLCSALTSGVSTGMEDSSDLLEAAKSVGAAALELIEALKTNKTSVIATQANGLHGSLRSLQRVAQEQLSVTSPEEKLGDLVEEEMSATASAVESAALKIQEMLRKSREDDSGIKLEVNERILDSCTELMKAIKVLIARSRDLQGEIIREGMGTLTDSSEFYQKNSRWSEGLISAAKQVGWGATVLVEGADKVVTRTGKFEELVVASHNIAASTAQLVAASRVKAHPKSTNLKSLKVSSRAVSEATGQVVASTQSGLTLVKQDSEAKMDYSSLSLTQAKRLEMESQVKALELEKELETERTRLAELRKIHYKIAGASEGWDENDEK